jgi:hypothetical protein
MAERETYNRHDIQRYLQHKMSAQEMHDFEKALMDDPFLADAIDGFSSSNEALATQHLSAIESAIAEQKPNAKVVTMPAQNTPSWKVASAAMLIVVAAGLMYVLLHLNGAAPVAPKQVETVPQKQIFKIDSIGPAEKPLAKMHIFVPKKKIVQKSSGSPIVYLDINKDVTASKPDSSSIASTNMVAETPVAPSREPATEKLGFSAKSTMLQSVPQLKEFKGQVLDESGEPVPFASVVAGKIAASADAKGNFVVKAPDSVLEVKVNTVGFQPATAEINSGSVNKIVLKEKEQSLSEVVVTALASRKKTPFSNIRVDTSTAPTPVGGWSKFNSYVSSQIDSIKAVEDDEYDNENIELTFSIDKKGRPTDIRAEEPANQAVAEKAKQILTNGPDWKNRKKVKKAKVTISF